MISLKKELENKIEKICHVYIFAQEVYLYTEYFHNPDTKEELELVINSAHSRHLNKIMHFMFRSLVSEISKLFSRSENDKFRLESFINSLSSTGHFRNLNVSTEKVKFWQDQLESNKDTIDNIILLRSKLYAHTDNPLTDFTNIDISFKQVKSLLDLASLILKEIYSDIFQSHLVTDSPSFDRKNFGILKLLVKAENDRKLEIINRYRS
jgi:AbiU2